jgi:hypothetical protein
LNQNAADLGIPRFKQIRKDSSAPRGNMTGLTFMAAEFNGERQYMRRAAIVANPAHPGEHLELIRHRSTGRQLGVHTVGLTIPSALLATVDELIE